MVVVQCPADPGYCNAQYLLPHRLESIVKCHLLSEGPQFLPLYPHQEIQPQTMVRAWSIVQ